MYVVEGVRLESVYEVLVVVVSSVVPLYTLYPVTPTASNDALHDSAICDDDSVVASRLVGCVGGVVSGVVMMGELTEKDIV